MNTCKRPNIASSLVFGKESGIKIHEHSSLGIPLSIIIENPELNRFIGI
jgi:hypothetical protein